MATQFKVTNRPNQLDRCHSCGKSISEDEFRVQDGQFVTCDECDHEHAKMAMRDEGESFDNEDPLEGAVEPVGGTPSKDRPLYDRHGMLIGHTPIGSYVDDDYDL